MASMTAATKEAMADAIKQAAKEASAAKSPTQVKGTTVSGTRKSA